MQSEMDALQSELNYLQEKNHQMAQKALQTDTVSSQVWPPAKGAHVHDTRGQFSDTPTHSSSGGGADADSAWTIRAVRNTSGSGRSGCSWYTDDRLVLPPIDEEGPQSCGACTPAAEGRRSAEVCHVAACGPRRTSMSTCQASL